MPQSLSCHWSGIWVDYEIDSTMWRITQLFFFFFPLYGVNFLPMWVMGLALYMAESDEYKYWYKKRVGVYSAKDWECWRATPLSRTYWSYALLAKSGHTFERTAGLTPCFGLSCVEEKNFLHPIFSNILLHNIFSE